ncbi:HET-domain-containing protein, partial [Thozetella sp. PMI_491]
MRLLNLWTGAFEQFTDIKKVKYAILSHTWTDHEVTFEDFQRHPEEARQSPKIHWFCVTAFNLGYKYVWIDTCCIDKSSSAELSEAINSMFYWYQESGLCCVYLSDVPDIDDPVEQELAVRKSRWFTRGWTLQELLAPESVRFYNASWRAIGERNSPFSIGPPPSNQLPSWTKLISEITKIRDHCLKGRAVYLTASVAERMSWAAGRRTTRIEDRAYSLLGLFQINMALLYGEGANAFRRLQQEIINNTEDQTIFAWGYGLGSHSRSDSTCFCLADTPEDFQYGGQIRSDLHATDTHYSMTNRGLYVDLALTQ